LAEAQRRLEAGNPPGQLILSLGPDLGQCCGGRVVLRFEPLGRSDLGRIATLVTARPRQPVYLFGAGHVGRALVLALAPLPFDVTWVDPRRQEFPAAFPQGVTAIAPPDVPALVQEAPPGTFLLVMTHSHALDLAIVDAALRRPDLGLVGLIGSSTKRARFLGQLRQAGQSEAAIARLQCPIGVSGLRSKEPAVIAAGVAVQLLQRMEEAAPAQIVRAAANNPVWSNIA
jgi:xanthine dehydrogenase accessory factor